MTKHLTKITDFSPAEIELILHEAFQYKVKKDQGILKEDKFNGKVVAMVFEKASLRTKVAFEVAAAYFSATPVFLSSGQILASGNDEKGRESIEDIAKNLERFADIIIPRVYEHQSIQRIAASIQKPTINALCDKHHPTQALADLMAIQWHKGKSPHLKVVFVGDGNNVATSLMQICAMQGLDFSIASPAGYEIPQEEQAVAQEWATKSGSTLLSLQNPKEALQEADVVYTDTFVSMGQEHEKESRKKTFQNYQVNVGLLKYAKSDCIFMHCLPAHRGEEVTDEVMDGPNSIIFDQAECRLHIAKALLAYYLSL